MSICGESMVSFPEPPRLESELRNLVLGYYDFDRFQVFIGAHGDPDLMAVTLMHEAHHQRLNLHSTYGQVVNKVAKAVKDNEGASLAREYDALLEVLLSKCTKVHEMLATYGSLLEFGRTDLLPMLPAAYQECFRYMESALKCVPCRKQWRSAACWHLSRMAMFAKPHSIFETVQPEAIEEIMAKVNGSDLLSPDHRMELLHDAMQQFDFDAFLKRLEDAGAPAEYLAAFLEHDEPDEIMRALGKPVEEWPGVMDGWNFFVMHGFLDQFESLLPGLEDSRGDLSLMRMTEMMGAPLMREDREHGQNLDMKEREMLVEQCNQRIAFFGSEDRLSALIVSPENAPSDSTGLNLYRYVQTTFVVYLIAHGESTGGHQVEVHVTDMVQQGYLPHIVIQGRNEVDLFMIAGEVTTFIEIADDRHIWQKSVLEQLAGMTFLGKSFLHCCQNPIRMIEQLLYSGCVVQWIPLAVGYQRGPITPDAGVHVCLYWTNALPFPIFHLSNELMTNAIERFGALYIRDPQRFRRLSNDEVLGRISPQDFSRFIDHPVFFYYLRGTTAEEALAVARGK